MHLQDAIITEDSPEGATVYRLDKNDILCCASNRTFLYSKGKQCLETRYSKGKFDIDEVRMCIGINNVKGKHIYNVVKLDFAKSKSNNKEFESATNQKIIEESDGFSLWDNKTNKVVWKHNNICSRFNYLFKSIAGQFHRFLPRDLRRASAVNDYGIGADKLCRP